MEKLKLLALSGSLRKASYNTSAIQALKILAPEHIEITIGDIETLPLFNPDREDEDLPSLRVLKKSLGDAAGLIIATPEYAHGISGPLKNALDWLVSGVEFPDKPIMLVNTSPRANHAQEALREVLSTMSGVVIEKACVSIPLLSTDFSCNEIVEDRIMADTLKVSLSEFCKAIKAQKLRD